jgi:hypothetical protein
MSTDRYDPTNPEGDPSSSNPYLTKKDVKVIGIIIVALGIVLYPMYRYGVRQSEKERCSMNMKAISEALNLYAEAHEGRYPPVYRTGDGNAPGFGETGRAYTWCDDIAPFMNKRVSFICPSSDPSEAATMEDPTDSSRVLKTTYGMYAPYGGYPISLIANPDDTALIAETSNLGSAGSYDPMKFKAPDGSFMPDGFVIGWDNSNDAPNAQTKSVTRLAYRDTANGVFKKDGESRHDNGIHVMTANGARQTLPPTAALIERPMGQITGLWTIPLVRAAP